MQKNCYIFCVVNFLYDLHLTKLSLCDCFIRVTLFYAVLVAKAVRKMCLAENQAIATESKAVSHIVIDRVVLHAIYSHA